MKTPIKLAILLITLLMSPTLFAQCEYQIELTDPGYGDGWNGGTVSVFVDGVAVLSNVTLPSEFGPVYYSFNVTYFGVITTQYTPGAWSYENNYKIIDPDGVVIFETGYPNGTPGNFDSGYVGCPGPIGCIEGFVYGSDTSDPIENAKVGISERGIFTFSDADGSYLLDSAIAGENQVYCMVSGINIVEALVNVTENDTVSQDFYVVPPNVSVQPDSLEETLNPGEYLTSSVTLFNTGDGDAHWTVEISEGDSSWLYSENDEGIVPANGNQAVSIVFNADSTNSGDEFNGEVHFIIHPHVDTVVVAATMLVSGDPLAAVTNLSAVLGNSTTGKVNLAWDFVRVPEFQYFKIERDGEVIGTTTNQFFSDFLPDYGTYSYRVFPVYDEGNGLPGGPAEVIWGLPVLVWSPDTLGGVVWADNQKLFTLKLKNTGIGQLHFEFPGFSDPYFSNAYITNVTPFIGNIAVGDSTLILVTFGATGYPIGSYTTDLVCETNESAPDSSRNIPTKMDVFSPATIEGMVTECGDGSQLEGIEISALNQDDSTIVFTTQTLYNGSYQMLVSEGTYDVSFHRTGYEDTTHTATALEGETTILDACMNVIPYPVGWVTAQVKEEDTECYVEWSPPTGPYEIIYDDGTAEDYVVYVNPGSTAAVRFTPAGYPATVTGGRIYVGDGLFPPNANFLGSQVAVGIIDDDGINNYPGTVLDSVVITISNYGWVEFNDVFDRTITDGDYYIAVWQFNGGNQSAPIGIDNEIPISYRSYARLQGFDWVVSSYQDMMIRSTVNGPDQGVTMNTNPNRLVRPVKPVIKCYMATKEPNVPPGYMKAGEYKRVAIDSTLRGFVDYEVERISDFDPNNGPYDGIKTMVAQLSETNITDSQYVNQPQGWYAYAVRANYYSGESKWVYSSIVPHLMDATVTFNVSLCDTSLVDDIEVTLTGLEYPYNTYFLTSGNTGTIYFDSIIKGHYNIRIYKVGYQPVEYINEPIPDDYVNDTTLYRNAYRARNLYVDSLTSVATWDKPLITQLYKETFEDTIFPPPGWQQVNYNDPCGWYRSSIDAGEMGEWIIPDWDGHYAVVNDDYCGVTGAFNMGNYDCVDNFDLKTFPGRKTREATASKENRVRFASMDYLITPKLDLRESDQYELHFDTFFDKMFGGIAEIEYSLDNGNTWQLIEEMEPNPDWWHYVVDLSSISGKNGAAEVWIGFHFSNGGDWVGGWTVDNVEIHDGLAPADGYLVYLDSVQVAELPSSERTYTFEDLVYDSVYTASVRAKYECGLSDPIYYTWHSTYLYPPRNLDDDYVYNTATVPLKWLPPIAVADTTEPSGLLSFNLYRNGNLYINIPYQGEPVNQNIYYNDMDLTPGTYLYEVSALYDLTKYGYPGEIGESLLEGIDTVKVIWGELLPFSEDWFSGSLDFNNWTTSSANWRINTQTGDDAPSVEFYREPRLENQYESSLTSTPINADKVTEGDIWLDYNLRLDDSNATGNEHLKVEIYNGEVWNEVSDTSNNGSFNFADGFYHVRLSKFALGNAFSVRFTATGENSHDIYSWFIDNIHIYRVCPTPMDLTGEYVWIDNPPDYEQYGAQICWQAPDTKLPIGEWVHWDSGENFSAVGLEYGGSFSVAARWDAGQLADYEGTFITKLQYFIASTDFNNIIVKIWTGANADNLLYAKDVTTSTVAGMWNEVTLDTSFVLDVDKELWIGYTIVGQEIGTTPAGTDEGPAVKGYGDMITTDGLHWFDISGSGLNYNWNIEVFVKELDVAAVAPTPFVDRVVYSTPDAIPVLGANNKSDKKAIRDKPADDRSIKGFKLYRSETGDDGTYIEYATIPIEASTKSYCYQDLYPDVLPNNTYWYKVTAFWEGNEDSCESGFAPSMLIPELDFVSVLVTRVDNHEDKTVNIYPNPASEGVAVMSNTGLKRITIINYSGQNVYQKSFNGENRIELNTSGFDAGVYIFKVETANETFVKRVVIAK